MSSQKGNVSRNRAQKYKNTRAFQNDLHDTTPKAKFLNSLEITDVCPKCKGVLEWRIKYRKYKLLKNPATCAKCRRKNVTHSYRTMCKECAEKLNVCPKCGLTEEEQKVEALTAKLGNTLSAKSSSHQKAREHVTHSPEDVQSVDSEGDSDDSQSSTAS